MTYVKSLFIPLAIILSATTASAGEYWETGRISSVRADNAGNCSGNLSFPRGEPAAFTWDCSTAKGKNILIMINTAYLTGVETKVGMLGNGMQYKPLVDIQY